MENYQELRYAVSLFSIDWEYTDEEYRSGFEDFSQANSLEELIEMENIIKSSSIYKGAEHQYEFMEYLGNDNWKQFLEVSDESGQLLK